MTDPTPQTTTPTRDEAVLRYYADTFCELGSHHECCGKLNKDECSGCLARSALASAPAPASGGVDAVARRAKYLLNRLETDDGLGIGEIDTMLRMAASLSPAATPVSEAEPVAWARMTGAEITHLLTEKRPGYAPLYLAKPASSPACGDVVREALAALLDHVDRETCTHEETHRGGFIWTICDQCGRKWADDQGGFVPHTDPPAVARARLICEGVASQSTSAGRVGE